jgi:hypothetical protein
MPAEDRLELTHTLAPAGQLKPHLTNAATVTRIVGKQLAATAPASPEGEEPAAASLPRVLAALHVLKGGWGEPALRFAVKCAQTAAQGVTAVATDTDAVDEAALWRGLTWAASAGRVDASTRTHLRRAWRECEKVPPPEPVEEPEVEEPPVAAGADGDREEEGTADGGAGDAAEQADGDETAAATAAAAPTSAEAETVAAPAVAAPPPPPPPPPRVAVDDFVARLAGDPVLARWWTHELPVAAA